jgi:hypothetical protein
MVDIDEVQIQIGIMQAHIFTLENALLGVCKELLPPEQYKAVCINFYERLHGVTCKHLDLLEGIPQKRILSEKFEAFQAMNRNLEGVDSEFS